MSDVKEPTNAAEMMACYTSLLPWWVVLIWGLLSFIIGIMFLTTPGITTLILITFIGAYWLVGGLFTLGSLFVDKTSMGLKIFLAVVNILAGIIILAYPLYSTVFILGFFAIFIGFWGCFIGAAHLYQAFTTKDAGNGVLGIISLIFGLIILIFPVYAAELIPLVVGVFALITGIAAVFAAFQFKKVSASPAQE
jgi:uncharacterized membrane protein HdeD (DUF308 family)